jgi:hypothetical protein
VHRDTIIESNQQDATILVNLLLFIVSGVVFAHHQEHLTAFTVSGSIRYNNKFVTTGIVL